MLLNIDCIAAYHKVAVPGQVRVKALCSYVLPASALQGVFKAMQCEWRSQILTLEASF